MRFNSEFLHRKNNNSQVSQVARGDDREAGSALVEFIALSAMLMVPTVYFLLSIFAMQSAAFAASNSSAQAVQVLTLLPAEQRSSSAAQNIATLAASDFGIRPDQVSTSLACEATCAPGEKIVVEVSVTTDLPLVPWTNAPSMATMTSSATSWGGNYS